MLEFNNLTITHKASGRVLLSSFSFTLQKGDKAAVIGEEGDGKSTLLRAACDMLAVREYCTVDGFISLHGYKAAYLPQFLPDNEKNREIWEYFEGCDPGDAYIAMQRLGVEGFYGSDRHIGTLSGGESVRVRLAALTAANPDILLLDEPTNDIDLKTLMYMERFISETPLPVLYVSHDEMLIRNTANVIIHLEQLRKKRRPRCTVARMGYGEYTEAREDLFAKQEMVARKQRAEHKAQLERWRKIYEKVDTAQKNISRGNPSGGRLLKKKMKSVKAQEKRLRAQEEDMAEIPDREPSINFTFDTEPIPAGKALLRLDLPELRAGNRVISRDIKLNIFGGEHIAIIGDNGCGKTTLLREVVRRLSVYDGSADVKAGYMPQNYDELIDGALSAVDFLAPDGDKVSVTEARTRLGSLKFTPEEMTAPASSLSGGQRAKLLLLKLALDGCNFLILDEPTRNFSPVSNAILRNMLSSYKGSILAVSHDRMFISDVCDSIYIMDETGLKVW